MRKVGKHKAQDSISLSVSHMSPEGEIGGRTLLALKRAGGGQPVPHSGPDALGKQERDLAVSISHVPALQCF